MRFRPCIDLHDGKVKQIVGGSLSDRDGAALTTNFVADAEPEFFAEMYRRDGLVGGHVIMLGKGNEAAAERALRAYPGGLQAGGGITAENARWWLEAGAAKVIVTSYVFRQGRMDWAALARLVDEVGTRNLVLDLSCRRRGDSYWIVTDRWQNFTEVVICEESLSRLADRCSEFLVHAVDVEGRQQGMDEALVAKLAAWSPLPVTYAGGVRNLDDLLRLEKLGRGGVDATVGSALDIFGGTGLRYEDAVAFDKARRG